MDVAIFWDIAPCSPYVNRRFGRTYHLHLHGRWSSYVPTNRLFTYELRDATYQKMATFMPIVVRISNLSLSHSLTPSLNHSLTHSLPPSLTPSLPHSLSLSLSLSHSHTHTHTHTHTHIYIYIYIYIQVYKCMCIQTFPKNKKSQRGMEGGSPFGTKVYELISKRFAIVPYL
jgi:hypothetical protein